MADRGDDSESTGQDSAAASSIDGPSLNEAIDPMGLGGVGGGWFGGDPAGSGGSFLTGNPNTTGQQDATVSQNIKSFMAKHNIEDLDFWDTARKGVIAGRIGLEALGLEFDAKYGLIRSKSLISFFSPKTEKETEKEAKARAAQELDNLFSNILDKNKDLSSQEKSALADILANEVTDAWQGTTKGLMDWDIASRINPMVKDAIESWKDKNNVPQSNIPSIYDKSFKSKDFPQRFPVTQEKGFLTEEKNLFQIQMEQKRDKVGSLISSYLDKNADIQTVMDTVAANQNKGKLFGNTQNVGYKGPVKGITTPLGPGQTFTQVQANVPTSQWSAAQHAQVGPFAGMLGLKGQGLNPSSLEPVADVSFNPSISLGNFNTNTGLHGTAGYNTQTGAYGNIGATTTGNLFGGTFGANIGYNTNTGPTAGLNLNYNW